ncbi:hypothetical protein [Marinicauda sp. Alg238-R41]|uniref:hypothetical protein n=1 Tax=Marinicauda sp. Alg238-R41 TaxID=2993447 RepID=UPI0022E28ADC|nr:hypothetical protein [Marinicauda sp. Alg238-R41]
MKVPDKSKIEEFELPGSHAPLDKDFYDKAFSIDENDRLCFFGEPLAFEQNIKLDIWLNRALIFGAVSTGAGAILSLLLTLGWQPPFGWRDMSEPDTVQIANLPQSPEGVVWDCRYLLSGESNQQYEVSCSLVPTTEHDITPAAR